MKIIGFAKGVELTKAGERIEGIKVYYTENIPTVEKRDSLGRYGALAFFPDVRSDGRPQIDLRTLEDYIADETEVDIFFNNFGRNPVIIPR